MPHRARLCTHSLGAGLTGALAIRSASDATGDIDDAQGRRTRSSVKGARAIRSRVRCGALHATPSPAAIHCRNDARPAPGTASAMTCAIGPMSTESASTTQSQPGASHRRPQPRPAPTSTAAASRRTHRRGLAHATQSHRRPRRHAKESLQAAPTWRRCNPAPPPAPLPPAPQAEGHSARRRARRRAA